jgi:alpha-aminoadipate carrier protein LysW
MKVKCPECDAEFKAPEDVIVGEVLSCPDCGLELEVCGLNSGIASVKPVKIAGEDWGE